MTATTATDPTHETSEPDRFWTTVNALEATPLVLTAMDWTFWKKSLELAAMRAWSDLGIVAPDEVVFVDDANQRVTASFLGRQAVNIDRVRWIMGSLPGTSGDDIERDLFGEVRDRIRNTRSFKALDRLAEVTGLLDGASRQTHGSTGMIDSAGHLGSDPPARIGAEANVPIGIEPLRGAQ